MNEDGTINIIGNGFDVAHGLKTSYWDFWEYLKNSKYNSMIFLCKNVLPNLENLWSSLEENIPTIINDIYLYCLKVYSVTFESSGLNYDQRKAAYHICIDLWEEFYNWILSEDWDPDTPVTRRKYPGIQDALFNSEWTTVINFNYTDSPSYVYIPVNDIYIHGSLVDKDSIIFGHPDSDDWEKIDKVYKSIKHGEKNPMFPDRFKADYDSIKRTYKEIFKTSWNERYVKNYEKTIPKFRKNLELFCKYPATKVVNVFGHSFGVLDDRYFSEILCFLKLKMDNPKWNLYYYSNKDLIAAQRFVNKFKIKNVSYIKSLDLLGDYTEVEIPVVRR